MYYSGKKQPQQWINFQISLKRKVCFGLADGPEAALLPAQFEQREHGAQHTEPREFPWRPLQLIWWIEL